MDVEESVSIAAAPERVWSVMSDVERWPEWTASVTSVQRLDDGPLRVGSRVRIRQPRLPTTTWTVTEVDDGRSFTWQTRSPGARTTARHRVEPAGDGSVATLSIDQEGPLARLVGLVAGRLTERYVLMEATGLRSRSEQEAGGTPR